MAYDVKVDHSLVYELISSFMIYTTQKWVNNLDVGLEWIAEVDTRLTPEERHQFVEAAKYPFTDYDVLYVWALERKGATDIPQFLNDIRANSKQLYPAAQMLASAVYEPYRASISSAAGGRCSREAYTAAKDGHRRADRIRLRRVGAGTFEADLVGRVNPFDPFSTDKYIRCRKLCRVPIRSY